MKTSIIYISSHGTTEKIARMIKAELPEKEIELIDLMQNKKPELEAYNQIILGASIHAGSIPKRMRKLMEKHIEQLKTKYIGLYLCCMYEGDIAQEQMVKAFPEELRKHAKSSKILGGEYIFEKMNFFERAIVKKISGNSETISKIKVDEIRKFAKNFN